MPTFDGVNLTVTLDAPTGGVLNVDVQEDLYEPWKLFVLADPLNTRFPPVFRSVAGDPLVSPLNIAPYFFMRNDLGWRIISSDADQEINYIGNIIPQDATKPIIESTPGRTVLHLGLQSVTQGVRALETTIQDIHGGVQRSIYVDPGAGAGGNGYQQTPFNNFTDAADASAISGVKRIVVLGNIALDRSMVGYEFYGVGTPRITIGGNNVNQSEFKDIEIAGAVLGTIHAHDCLIAANATGLNGEFTNCGFGGDLTCANSAKVVMTDCYSDIGGLGRPTISLAAGNSNVAIRSYRGGLTIQNVDAGGDEVTVSMAQGKLTLAATCTDGTISVRGIAQFTDSSAGSTVDRTGLANTEEMRLAQELLEADQVFDEPNGLLHYYRRGTNVDLIPPKTVTTTQTQSTSLVQV